MWSHDVVSTSINLAGDLKIAQYLKVPPRVMFLTQVYGTILGAIVNYGKFELYRVSIVCNRLLPQLSWYLLSMPKGTFYLILWVRTYG